MIAACAGCGDCCDPVCLSEDMYRTVHAPDSGGPSVEFIREHWTVVGRDGDEYQLRCDKFDPVARQCTAYEDRPPVCSGYPWYDGEPDGDPALNGNCSFYWDLPAETRGSALYKLISLEPA